MKLSFKNILIIFLVALLGGAAGTYGVLEIKGTLISPTTETIENKEEETFETTVSHIETNNSSYADVVSKAINSVVEITTNSEEVITNFFGQQYSSPSTSLGSGVIISEDGYIITNEHVVSDATSVTVNLQNGDEYEATIIGTDEKTDLALLKIEATGLAYSKLIDSDELKLGQEVIAIGNALGRGTSCSNGIISALNRELTIDKYTMYVIQTNAAINNGNSGGGLFDMNGNLVGIVNAKTSYSSSATAVVEGMGYAIPANTVKTIAEELLNNGYVKDRPALGVKIYTSTFNEYYNVEGLVISEVIEGSAAEKAGLQANDIIKEINGEEVTEFSELSKILDSYKIGDVVKLTVERNGKTKTFVVTLQESTR